MSTQHMPFNEIMEIVRNVSMLPVARELDSTLKYLPDTKVDVWLNCYYDNGKPALVLRDTVTKETLAKLTVNLPPEHNILPLSTLAIKNYSENEGALTLLITNGIVRVAGSMATGHTQVTLAVFTPEVMERLTAICTDIIAGNYGQEV